ncbi:MAG: hypothetical protein CMJ31_07580 [Phycisphaerae bacterium]|nr:hypothetical protein [Phycisphaerae bacterium]
MGASSGSAVDWVNLSWVALAVGNSRTRVAAMRGGEVVHAASFDNADPTPWTDRLAPFAPSASGAAAAVCSSVAASHAEAASEAVARALGVGQTLRVGVDVPLFLRHALDDASTLGQDRVLNAIAAFERAKQACVVVDVGTAVTVDFVDGEGVFQGGGIAPGLSTMLGALHENTAALPRLGFEMPAVERGVFGKDTAHAMRLGVIAAVRGMVRESLDRYAEAYGGYPQVIGTGGDVGVLEATELVEHVVPDLQILGIASCLRRSFMDDEDGDDGA